MAILVYLPGQLREYAEGRNQVTLTGSPATVQAALDALWEKCPGVRDRVLNERGEVRQHVNVFVGDESIRFTGGLATPVPPQCEISIIPAVSGG